MTAFSFGKNSENQHKKDKGIVVWYIYWECVKKLVIGVRDYILRIRIYYAAKMIKEEKEDMLTIAIRFGFQSQEVFTRNHNITKILFK